MAVELGAAEITVVVTRSGSTVPLKAVVAAVASADIAEEELIMSELMDAESVHMAKLATD